MKTIKDRIVEYINYKKMSVRSFEIESGLSNGYVGRLRKEPSPSYIEKILMANPDLSRRWLLRGEGEMLKKPREQGARNEVQEVSSENYMLVECADLFTSAGRIGCMPDEILPDTHMVLVPREVESGNYLVVRVYGDSMDDGTTRSICDGDEILIRQVTPDEWLSLPIHSKIFLITSRCGNVVKQIVEVNREGEYLRCHSFNPCYKDFNIAFDDIFQVFVVHKLIYRRITL